MRAYINVKDTYGGVSSWEQVKFHYLSIVIENW